MRIATAVSVAVLAMGLGLGGAQAFAADQDGPRHGRHDNVTTQQHNGNGQSGQQGQKQHKSRTTGRQNTNTNQNNGQQNFGRNRNLRTLDNKGQHNGQANDRNRRNRGQDGILGGRRDRANDRNGRNRGIDLSRWHRNFNAPRRFHAGPYHGPRDYSYRRWGYGQRLPNVYFVRSFWLLDFLAYGLLEPPPGYIWVRYGPDALLVDQETGEIIQVEYNVFD